MVPSIFLVGLRKERSTRLFSTFMEDPSFKYVLLCMLVYFFYIIAVQCSIFIF